MELRLKLEHKLHSVKCYIFALKLSCSQIKEKTMTSYAIYYTHKNNKIISVF